MADDWVKMRTDLYRDPKVCLVADCLLAKDGALASSVEIQCRANMAVTRNVMRNAVVGALVTVWGTLRRRASDGSADLTIKNATLSVIDDMADLPGLGNAMAAVGWCVVTPEGVVLPNFFNEYNVSRDDKSREQNRERQQRHRDSKKCSEHNVTHNVIRNDREEKRREEIDTHTQARAEPATLRTWKIPPGCSEPLTEAIDQWQRYRLATKGRPQDDISLEMTLANKRNAGWDESKIVQSIRKSIEWQANSWRDPDADHDEATKAKRNSHGGANGRRKVKFEDVEM